MTIANTISSTTIKQIRSKVNEIIGVVNTLGTGNVSNTYLQQIIANTNSYIATKTNESASLARLANTNNYIATKINTTTFNAALANTNAYIASVASQGGGFASEALDYGSITTEPVVEFARDYGSL
jgi:hypothetical protein